MFRDITTLMKDPIGLNLVINEFSKRYAGLKIDKIAGIEARGFIIGAPIAYTLGIGFIPIRKQGKLPAETIGCDYSLEYGTDRIEIHADAFNRGTRIVLVDDLIATGGTSIAAIKLLQGLEAIVVAACFVIDLPDLGGRKLLESRGHQVHALCAFEGD